MDILGGEVPTVILQVTDQFPWASYNGSWDYWVFLPFLLVFCELWVFLEKTSAKKYLLLVLKNLEEITSDKVTHLQQEFQLKKADLVQ